MGFGRMLLENMKGGIVGLEGKIRGGNIWLSSRLLVIVVRNDVVFFNE